MPGSSGEAEIPDRDAGIAQFADRREPQIGPRSARLHQTRQARTQRSDRDIHAEARTLRDLLARTSISRTIRLDLVMIETLRPSMPRQFFKTRARDPVFLFGGLVRIGRRADADVFRNALPALREYEYFLAISRVSRTAASFFTKIFFSKAKPVQLHEFVRVARVTIFAGEFAAPIGIDGPVKGDAAEFALVQDRFHRKQKVFRALLRICGASDAAGEMEARRAMPTSDGEPSGAASVTAAASFRKPCEVAERVVRNAAGATTEGNPSTPVLRNDAARNRRAGQARRSVVWATYGQG